MKQLDQGKPQMEDLFASPAVSKAPAPPESPAEPDETPEFDPDAFNRTSGTVYFPGADLPQEPSSRSATSAPPVRSFPQQDLADVPEESPAASFIKDIGSGDKHTRRKRIWGIVGAIIGLIAGIILSEKLDLPARIIVVAVIIGERLGSGIYYYLIDTT